MSTKCYLLKNNILSFSRILSPLLGSQCFHLETKLDEQFLQESKRGILSGRESKSGNMGKWIIPGRSRKAKMLRGEALLPQECGRKTTILPLFLFTICFTSWHRREVILQSLSWHKCICGEKRSTSHLCWETGELLPAASFIYCDLLCNHTFHLCAP